MTKEEALKILRKDLLSNLVDYYSSEELQDAIDTIVSQPSLPSNLDEAANNYGRDIRLGYPRVMDETDKYIYNAFKAGAEWMAGQMPKWKPAAMAYEGDRLPRYDWQLGRIVARDEDGIYYLTMADLYQLPKEETK